MEKKYRHERKNDGSPRVFDVRVSEGAASCEDHWIFYCTVVSTRIFIIHNTRNFLLDTVWQYYDLLSTRCRESKYSFYYTVYSAVAAERLKAEVSERNVENRFIIPSAYI